MVMTSVRNAAAPPAIACRRRLWASQDGSDIRMVD